MLSVVAAGPIGAMAFILLLGTAPATSRPGVTCEEGVARHPGRAGRRAAVPHLFGTFTAAAVHTGGDRPEGRLRCRGAYDSEALQVIDRRPHGGTHRYRADWNPNPWAAGEAGEGAPATV